MDLSDTTVIQPPPFEFAHYAHLLRSVMPRAREISLYGAAGELRWASEGVERPELRPAIEDVLNAAEGLQGLDPEGRIVLVENEPACLFRLTGESGELLGILTFLCPPASYSSGPPEFQRTRQQLAPLLELLRRDLGARHKMAAASIDATLTQELAFLLGPTLIQSRRIEPLQHYIDGYRERTGCDGVLLLIPDWRVERWSGITPADAAAPALRKLAATSLWKLTQAAPQVRLLDARPTDASGSELPYRYLVAPLGHGTKIIGLVLAVQGLGGRPFVRRDIERLHRFLPRLQETLESRFDARTGLLQRAAFELEVAAARELESEPALVVLADLDRTHMVNDLYGFAAGDSLIRNVGALWRAAAAESGAPATRLAGDRYAALLPTADVARGRAWSEALRAAVAALKIAPMQDKRAGAPLTMSCGIARLEPGQPLEHALAAAEIACNTAKQRGRDRIEVYDASAGSLAEHNTGLKRFRALTSALETGRFMLYAQPVQPLWDRSRPGEFEILVRMRDARGQPVAPAEFLPTAERYQLLPQLDRWVMVETLKQLGPYAQQFAAQGVRWTLNVSSASLADDDYTDLLFNELDAQHLPGSWLAIDIAETAATADLDATRRFVERVAPRGISVALDDFGNGGSALAHLKLLSVRRLKIDGVLVRDVVTDATSDGLVRAVVQIGRQLGLETSGESIADVAIARHLAALGVDYGQGNYFGEARPLIECLNAQKDLEHRRSA